MLLAVVIFALCGICATVDLQLMVGLQLMLLRGGIPVPDLGWNPCSGVEGKCGLATLGKF